MYDHWREVFYPTGLPKSKWLEFYRRSFDTVELNNPFYRLPKKETFEKWAREVPADFVYSVKASRYITHVKKLHEVDEALSRMLEHYRGLGGKLAVILFQFPASWHKNVERLAGLLDLLPGDIRTAFEFRHESWFSVDIYDLLEKHGAALCIADSPRFPKVAKVTAPFTFVRMHGGSVLYGSEYSDEELREWARRIEGFLNHDVDTFVYFNNDAQGYAVANARRLKSLLGLST